MDELENARNFIAHNRSLLPSELEACTITLAPALPHPQIRAVAHKLSHDLVESQTELLPLLPQIGVMVLACSARDREVAPFGPGTG